MKLRNLMKKFTKEQSGFTLIELMVVVVVLGILASLVVPRITGDVTDDAQQTADDANLKMIQAALNRYEVDTAPVTGDMSHDELAAELTGEDVGSATFSNPSGWTGPYLDEVPDGYSVDDGEVIEGTPTQN